MLCGKLYDNRTEVDYIFLKLNLLINSSETRGLTNPKPVEMLQDQAQCILSDYIRTRYPRQPARFGRFLLLLPSLQAVKPSTVELLFFRETIGEIPIARLLGDMYQMEHHNADTTLNFRGGYVALYFP